MVEFLENYQVHVLLAASMVCFFQAIYILLIQGQSLGRKFSLFILELSATVLLLADGMAYIFRGNTSQKGFWMVRISNFTVFFNILLMVFSLNLFLTFFLMESGRFEKMPKHLLLGFILPCIGTTLLIISQFTGWYYFFDENNRYCRGPLYLVSYLIPYCCMLLMLVQIICQRKFIRKRIFVAVAVFIALPMIAGIAQIFCYGLSFINISLWVSADILFATVLSDQNIRLAKSAETEAYTGLPNAYGYMNAVDRVIAFKDITEYDGFYFDIVRMGQINDKYGKEKGDEIILDYATKIKKTLEPDEILGRLGGNFFVALVKRTNTEKFLRLLANVPITVKTESKTEIINMAAVAGIYQIQSKRIAAGQIVGKCATALTYAKTQAHVPYAYLDKNLEERYKRVRIIEEKTQKALDKGEFEAYYQPKIDSRTKAIIGAEALVRWVDNGEVILPLEFVRVMEKNRSIQDLDFYMLNKVCGHMKEWIEAGLNPVPVSVNFSKRDLDNPNLAEEINAIAEKFGIPKYLLQVEITETIDEYAITALMKFVDKLHEYGFTAAIDDFGIGSASVNLLKLVKFDVLKIDKTFIYFENEKDRILLQSIIHLAKDLDIETIAEGVETKEQVEDLKLMGCYRIQGFTYSVPLTKEGYQELLGKASV